MKKILFIFGAALMIACASETEEKPAPDIEVTEEEMLDEALQEVEEDTATAIDTTVVDNTDAVIIEEEK